MGIHVPLWLVLPLQEVYEYLIEIAADRIELADTQIVQLLREVPGINLMPLPGLDKDGCGLRPGVKVVRI
jgi:hypothetical protein